MQTVRLSRKIVIFFLESNVLVLERKLSSKHIHVIEDEEDIATLIQFNLSLDGHKISCSNTGEVGLDYIKSHPVDLIVLDLMLPGIEGLEICRLDDSFP